MATYELDNYDAYRIVETLISLADLIELAGPDHPAYLTEDQLRSLHRLPVTVAATDRAKMAYFLREAALSVYRQMPDDSPDVSGPYVFRGTIDGLEQQQQPDW